MRAFFYYLGTVKGMTTPDNTMPDAALGSFLNAGREAQTKLDGGTQTPQLHDHVARAVVARDILIERNIGNAVNVAKRWQASGADTEELRASALLGLCLAVGNYDHTKGYLQPWVALEVNKHLTRTAHLYKVGSAPTSRSASVRRSKVQGAILRFMGQGVNPTVDELMDATNLPRHLVLHAMNSDHSSCSLDDSTNGPTRYNRNMPDLDQVDDQTSASNDVAYMLKGCSQEERAFLSLRFGLDGSEPMEVRNAGAEIGLGEREARELETALYARLRGAQKPDVSTPALPAQRLPGHDTATLAGDDAAAV